MVLVMTVEPGFGGQSLIPSTLDSVRAIRQMINESGRDVDLEVDGGISPANVKDVTSAGANVIVAGSAVFKSADIPATIAALKA